MKQFADENGRLHVYDRITQKTLRRQHVKDVAVVSNLYTFEDSEGNLNDSFEQGPLARFDDTIAKLLPKMLEPMPTLTIRERVHVCLFITLQYLRTQDFRNRVADANDMMWRMEVEMNVGGASPDEVEQFINRRYPDASDQRKALIRNIAADPSQPVELPDKEWFDWLAANLGDAADPVIQRCWTFAEPEAGAFLSCDNPVVLLGAHSVGLETASVIFWPLSPTRLLILGPRNKGDRYKFQVGSMPPDVVCTYNQATVDQAARQVFWHPDTDPLSGVVLPTGELMGFVNGIPVGRSEFSYDKHRQEWLEFRDRMRAQQKHSNIQTVERDEDLPSIDEMPGDSTG